MTNKKDDIDALWLQQSVQEIDVGQLHKEWTSLRIKQWLYFFVDLIPSLAFPVIVYVLREQLNTFERVWMYSLVALGTVFFFYVVWLRRFSLSAKGQAASTKDYAAKIIKQYQQNIKIASITKFSALFMPFAFAIYFIGIYMGEYFEIERFIRKLTLASLVIGISTPTLYLWAKRRKKKFETLLIQFNRYTA